MSVEVQRVKNLKSEWEQAKRDLDTARRQPYGSGVSAAIKAAEGRVTATFNAYDSARNSLPADKRSQV